MSSWDFIVDQIRFSFSSLTTYETCPYSFRLTYIDKHDRINNFYGEYGTLIHSTMYEYFSNKLDTYELSQYFKDNYSKVVLSPPPAYPSGMEEKYRDAGIEFFDNFSFPKENYDIIINEEKIEFEFNNDKNGNTCFVAKPDLVLLDKQSENYILMDYKTSAPYKINKYNGKEVADNKKLDGYYKQMYIYTYALRNYMFIPIDEITLWFTRPDRKVSVLWKEKDEEKAIAWLKKTVDKIKLDEHFLYNNDNPYFCNNLCSVRELCEFKSEKQ